MTQRVLCQSWRLVRSVILLSLLGIGCRSQVVSIDMRKLHLHQNGTSLPEQISLIPVGSVGSLQKSVRSRIPKMSNPGGSFAATDVVILPGTPTRRLVFGGISDRYCLVHYEYGGIGHGYKTALFALSGNQSIPLWVHSGGRYDSMDQFAKETDQGELTNEVDDAIF
jgi:hypothetical protein